MKSVPKPRGMRRVQYAALPYRQRQDGEIQIRLITSRETRRWVIPKGWPMKGLSPSKAAAREAYEEAGLLGAISSEPLGLYSYDKRLTLQTVPCDVMVFPLKVKRYVKKWPERSERFGFWFSVESAAAAVQEEDLRTIILAFGDQMAARFAEKRSRRPEAAAQASAPGETAGMDQALAKPLSKAAAKAKIPAKGKTPAKAKALPKDAARDETAAADVAPAHPKSATKPKAKAATLPEAKSAPKADAKAKAVGKPKAPAKEKQKVTPAAGAVAPSDKSAKTKTGKAKPQGKAKGQRVVLAVTTSTEPDWAQDDVATRLPLLSGVTVPSTRH